MGKVVSQRELQRALSSLRRRKKKIVFTNGCFDLLHIGHIKSLTRAKRFGDVLVVGLNGDASVRKLKGKGRPLMPQKDRAEILGALSAVDYVTIFSELTPLKLIKKVKPDVLAKGEDYHKSEIVGGDFVKSYGGRIRTISLAKGKSTRLVIQTILRRYGRSRYSS